MAYQRAKAYVFLNGTSTLMPGRTKNKTSNPPFATQPALKSCVATGHPNWCTCLSVNSYKHTGPKLFSYTHFDVICLFLVHAWNFISGPCLEIKQMSLFDIHLTLKFMIVQENKSC